MIENLPSGCGTTIVSLATAPIAMLVGALVGAWLYHCGMTHRSPIEVHNPFSRVREEKQPEKRPVDRTSTVPRPHV